MYRSYSNAFNWGDLIVKILISSSYGTFEPVAEFANLVTERGHESIYDIKARTDEVLIDYVENNSVTDKAPIIYGSADYMLLTVVEVDTSKPWYIDTYDGSEVIKYLEYECIDKDLNLIRLL